MKKMFACFLAIVVSNIVTPQNIKNYTVWSNNDYSAFTSLVRYNRHFYCAFRESDSHVVNNIDNCGVIKIMSSKNGKRWKEYLTYSEKGVDFRDPKLSVTPDNRLMLLTEGVFYEGDSITKRKSMVSFIDKNNKHSQLQPVQLSSSNNWNWIWDVVWIDGMAYGFTYVPSFSFVSSRDGIKYDAIRIEDVAGSPNETALAKYRDGLVAIARRGSLPAVVGFSSLNNLSEWKWYETSYKIAGPDILVVNDDIYISGRSYIDGERVTLFKWDDSLEDLEVVRHITESGDCSYPGMICFQNKLYLSYYWGTPKQTQIMLDISSLNE